MNTSVAWLGQTPKKSSCRATTARRTTVLPWNSLQSKNERICNMTIGKIQRVGLRKVWKHEARDFTTWIEENVDVINDSLDLNLVSLDREQSAGKFNCIKKYCAAQSLKTGAVNSECNSCYSFIRLTYFQTEGSRATARAIFSKSPGMKGYKPKSRTGLSHPMKFPSHIKPNA